MAGRRPSFFIIGAPKSGTTALYTYLGAHRAVFLAKPKDVHFFSGDLPGLQKMDSESDYLSLFSRAGKDPIAVGEASSMYLYSSEAVERIHAFEPGAKLFVLLRNPIDLVRSFHSQLVYSQEEDEQDFERAWNRQEERRTQRGLPKRCREPRQLQYREVARLGAQVERLLTIFPKDRIRFYLFEEFVSETAKHYKDALRFLDVEPDGRTAFPPANERKRHRMEWVGRFTEQPPGYVVKAARSIKSLLGIEELGILSKVRRLNARPYTAPELSPEFGGLLLDSLREDVALLGRLIERDLAHWTQESPHPAKV